MRCKTCGRDIPYRSLDYYDDRCDECIDISEQQYIDDEIERRREDREDEEPNQ